MSDKANPVGWFEIPVNDLDRAKKFYESVLGMELAPPYEMGETTMCFFPFDPEVLGSSGSLIAGAPMKPSHDGTRVYFSVAAIDPVLERVATAGGKTLLPRTSIGEHGFCANFEDTEGNCVSLHERLAE